MTEIYHDDDLVPSTRGTGAHRRSGAPTERPSQDHFDRPCRPTEVQPAQRLDLVARGGMTSAQFHVGRAPVSPACLGFRGSLSSETCCSSDQDGGHHLDIPHSHIHQSAHVAALDARCRRVSQPPWPPSSARNRREGGHAEPTSLRSQCMPRRTLSYLQALDSSHISLEALGRVTLRHSSSDFLRAGETGGPHARRCATSSPPRPPTAAPPWNTCGSW